MTSFLFSLSWNTPEGKGRFSNRKYNSIGSIFAFTKIKWQLADLSLNAQPSTLFCKFSKLLLMLLDNVWKRKHNLAPAISLSCTDSNWGCLRVCSPVPPYEIQDFIRFLFYRWRESSGQKYTPRSYTACAAGRSSSSLRGRCRVRSFEVVLHFCKFHAIFSGPFL